MKLLFSFIKKIPLILLLLWISIISIFIWKLVNQSQRPPIYDALTYYVKAQSFWENASKGFPINPFNLNPVVRPPGTVLLSYPLGFNKDYHGFLFRSVFIPFLIWVISILILVWPGRETYKKTLNWTDCLYVFLLGPLPFFFQFDYGELHLWGYMDSFFAAVSAMSLVLAIKSIEKKTRKWLLAAVGVASICPLIKPTGFLIFILVATFWSAVSLNQVYIKNNEEKKASVKFWLSGSLFFFFAGIIILYFSTSSEYLGQNSRAFFLKGVSVLNNETRGPLSWNYLFYLLYNVAGPQIILSIIFFIFLVVRSRKMTNTLIPRWNLLLSGLLFISIGVWFWISRTGITQPRYFYPFLLLGVIPLLHYSNEVIVKQEIKISGLLKGLVKGACILPAVNILLLLSHPNPDKSWQNVSGVEVNISIYDDGIELAKKLLFKLEKATTPSFIYVTDPKESASFINYGDYYRVLHPDIKGFYCMYLYDWLRPHAYRIHEMIIKSDYIVYKSMSPELQTETFIKFNDPLPKPWYEEHIVIEAFLNSLGPEEGLQTILEENKYKVSMITDRLKLKKAFEHFLFSRRWSSSFLTENHITPQGWKFVQPPKEGIPNTNTEDSLTSCDGSIDIVNGLYSTPDTIQGNLYFTIEGWLAYNSKEGINSEEIFIALTYPDKSIKYWPTYLYPRTDVGNAFNQSALINAGFISLIDLSDVKGTYTARLAMVYKGKLIHCNALKRIIINKQ